MKKCTYLVTNGIMPLLDVLFDYLTYDALLRRALRHGEPDRNVSPLRLQVRPLQLRPRDQGKTKRGALGRIGHTSSLRRPDRAHSLGDSTSLLRSH